jgi:hypothetical protein
LLECQQANSGVIKGRISPALEGFQVLGQLLLVI